MENKWLDSHFMSVLLISLGLFIIFEFTEKKSEFESESNESHFLQEN